MDQVIQIGARKRPPLPPWFRIKLPAGDKLLTYQGTDAAVRDHGLHTVCEEAHCPNIHDCWARGSATFMIAGQTCTRDCHFCSVEHNRAPAPLDPAEPAGLAAAIERMKLAYAVITVVNRDDLPDGGASHYRACLDAVHARLPEVGLELLCSDLDGNEAALAALLDGAPLKVFAHNVETVERLQSSVRDRKASFKKSLRMLAASKDLHPELMTKSSVMMGMGETNADVTAALKALSDARVDLLTFGQYLAPTPQHYPIMSYPPPEQFDAWKEEALALGFRAVASGPLVRSSFRAGSLYSEAVARAVATP
ncbi:MAG: lipoyl synthase [Lentisphaerae bacterium]|nr:lipoyl synthase [Lentisphaerota bacterium]